MAAFASFHIGEKLKLWNWKKTGIKSFSETCKQKSRNFEDDIQIIRVINNRIFLELGTMHLMFSQLHYDVFRNKLIEAKKNTIIIAAFDALNEARKSINSHVNLERSKHLIWKANTQLLWHEQVKVVQPMFDKLTGTFSNAMSLIASFDYNINHRKTSWKLSSRFVFFMVFSGLKVLRKNNYFPDVTNLEQRWFWISKDLLKKWKTVEMNWIAIREEITFLAHLENR